MDNPNANKQQREFEVKTKNEKREITTSRTKQSFSTNDNINNNIYEREGGFPYFFLHLHDAQFFILPAWLWGYAVYVIQRGQRRREGGSKSSQAHTHTQQPSVFSQTPPTTDLTDSLAGIYFYSSVVFHIDFRSFLILLLFLRFVSYHSLAAGRTPLTIQPTNQPTSTFLNGCCCGSCSRCNPLLKE